MLTSVKGIYENGVIKPLEDVHISGKSEVIITFLDSIEEKAANLAAAAGAWKDYDTDALKENIYSSRKIDTRGNVNL
jgi:predicted DNA-binding antitoxin AbrB/MazE fold protein